mmetsp:Transcript_41962/g.104377  ORF Transcript_41962/g.104377 Transcript_41962/m.104377 type:complete len:245 (+) Transcript_41962:147-881(+)
MPAHRTCFRHSAKLRVLRAATYMHPTMATAGPAPQDAPGKSRTPRLPLASCDNVQLDARLRLDVRAPLLKVGHSVLVANHLLVGQVEAVLEGKQRGRRREESVEVAGAAPVRRRAALVVQHGPQQHDRVRVDDVAVGCDTEEGRERARQHEPEGEVTRERALEHFGILRRARLLDSQPFGQVAHRLGTLRAQPVPVYEVLLRVSNVERVREQIEPREETDQLRDVNDERSRRDVILAGESHDGL